MTALPLACIYCGTRGASTSIAHIIPASLGGTFSPIAPSGVVCDARNQYFGQKVESAALASFPFRELRTFLGMPTKKGKMTHLESTLGRIHSTGVPGCIQIEPRDAASAEAIVRGSVSQFRIPAEVSEPIAVCRMLLKIGLEMLGKYLYDIAISERLDSARAFARRPSRGSKWYFILLSQPSMLFASHSPWEVEIREIQGVLCSVVRMPSAMALVPLENGSLPPSDVELAAPEYRIVWASL
jgi:hypothetical protein